MQLKKDKAKIARLKQRLAAQEAALAMAHQKAQRLAGWKPPSPG